MGNKCSKRNDDENLRTDCTCEPSEPPPYSKRPQTLVPPSTGSSVSAFTSHSCVCELYNNNLLKMDAALKKLSAIEPVTCGNFIKIKQLNGCIKHQRQYQGVYKIISRAMREGHNSVKFETYEIKGIVKDKIYKALRGFTFTWYYKKGDNYYNDDEYSYKVFWKVANAF